MVLVTAQRWQKVQPQHKKVSIRDQRLEWLSCNAWHSCPQVCRTHARVANTRLQHRGPPHKEHPRNKTGSHAWPLRSIAWPKSEACQVLTEEQGTEFYSCPSCRHGMCPVLLLSKSSQTAAPCAVIRLLPPLVPCANIFILWLHAKQNCSENSGLLSLKIGQITTPLHFIQPNLVHAQQYENKRRNAPIWKAAARRQGAANYSHDVYYPQQKVR